MRMNVAFVNNTQENAVLLLSMVEDLSGHAIACLLEFYE